MGLKTNARQWALRKLQLCYFWERFIYSSKKETWEKKICFSLYIFEGLDKIPGTSLQFEDGVHRRSWAEP